jgi:two-component system KDP operon response regulator KdpE
MENTVTKDDATGLDLLLEKVWGWEYVDDLDYVRIYIWHLRQKIEPDPAHPRYIITEPGVGYCFHKAD